MLTQAYPDDSDVVAEVLAAELGPDAHLLADLQHPVFPLQVSESTAGGISRSREAVEIPFAPNEMSRGDTVMPGISRDMSEAHLLGTACSTPALKNPLHFPSVLAPHRAIAPTP